jgi:hypothetical protein
MTNSPVLRCYDRILDGTVDEAAGECTLQADEQGVAYRYRIS